MDITRRCDYAYRILRAAYESGEGYVSVSEVAEREDIPYTFARSIQHDLVKGGLLRTTRGAHGGLSLSKDPSEMTMLDVLEAVQGPVRLSPCVSDAEYCGKSAACVFNGVWRGAADLLNAYLSSINLAELFEQGCAHPVVAQALSCDAAAR